MKDRHVIVFLGPTLPATAARRVLEADYRAPATQGDVLRAADEHPWAIAIIDGRFERVPAVWHKEILWALTRGIQLFGAASMGALRAAELEAFGMEGAGKIFEAYRCGDLTADDEVALIHTPGSHGYRQGSEAMVNIRATLAAARDQKILSPAVHDALVGQAKGMFYPERRYDAILRQAFAEGFDPEQLRRFEAWLPTGRIDQKRLDALALLQLIADRRRSGEEPPARPGRFTFQHTEAWSELCRTARQTPEAESPETPSHDPKLANLRARDPRVFDLLQERAWSRIFGLELARSHGVDEHLLADAVVDFCSRRQLESPQALEQWLNERGRSHDELLRHIRDNLKLERLRRIHASGRAAVLREMVDLDDPPGAEPATDEKEAPST